MLTRRKPQNFGRLVIQCCHLLSTNGSNICSSSLGIHSLEISHWGGNNYVKHQIPSILAGGSALAVTTHLPSILKHESLMLALPCNFLINRDKAEEGTFCFTLMKLLYVVKTDLTQGSIR